tara:strand:+ start:2207 stop:3790 length:1584 start_codon:yes stop_codon:yes gene_type:complete
MGNILIDMMGLLNRKRVVKNTEDTDYLVLGRRPNPDDSMFNTPKMHNELISIKDLKAGINSGEVTGSGTTNYIPVYSDGANSVIGDSQLRQSNPNSAGLYQMRMENADRFIINKPSSITSGDPEYLITQDGNFKVSFGWDDDGGGFGYLYNWSGAGLKLGSAGNNPMLEIKTTAGSEEIDLHKSIKFVDYGSGTYTGTVAYTLAVDTSGNVIETTGGTVTGVTGTTPVVSSGGVTPAISMPAATNSVSGYLTAADHTLFSSPSGTNIISDKRQSIRIRIQNKTVGSPNFDVVTDNTRVIYERQAGDSVNWSEYGKQWSPSVDPGYDAAMGFQSNTEVLVMLEESVKDVLTRAGNASALNSKFQIKSFDNWQLASQQLDLAIRMDNNGASPGNGTALIKLVEEATPRTGPPDLPSTTCVWFVDTTDTSSNMGGPIPTIVFAGKDTAYAKIVNGGNQYDAGVTYTFTGNSGDTLRKYAFLIEDEYYSNMRAKYLKVTGGRVVLQNLPTVDPLSNGVVWNDSGVLKISAG